MAEIAPLSPLRYDLSRLPGGLGGVVAPPYDVISADERVALAARDPHNVVRLILPEGEGDAKYGAAAETLARWRSERVLVRDDEPAFYRHDQTFVPLGAAPGTPTSRRRGFLALARVVPFSERVVLPHERTLSGPKEDRLKLFRATRTNLSPGFMLYRDPKGELGAALEAAEPLAAFTSGDGVEHALAKVREPGAVRAIVEGVARSTLLIADGHHRYETALRYSQEVAAATPGASPRGEHLYFMTFLVNGDDPNLVVFPTHRHVHSLPSFSMDDLVTRARESFEVHELARGVEAPVLVDALAREGKKGPSVVAASGDGRAAVLTLRAASTSRRTRRSGGCPGAPQDGRRRTAFGHPRAAARHHARGAGGEDQHPLPAGHASGPGGAPGGRRAGALRDERDTGRPGARRRRGRGSDAPEEHLLLPQDPHRSGDPHPRSEPPGRIARRGKERGPRRLPALGLQPAHRRGVVLRRSPCSHPRSVLRMHA